MLNIKNLNELKDKIQDHKVDWSEFTSKDQRRFKEHYIQDKKTLIRKIELIEESKDKVIKYEDDIAELLQRLKKIGFTFISENPPEAPPEAPPETSPEAPLEAPLETEPKEQTPRKSRVTPVL